MTTDDGRLTTLEERVAWLQHLTDELSGQVAAQDRRILELEAMTRRLAGAAREVGDDDDPAA